MSKVTRAAACIAVVAELLLTGIGAGLPTNSAVAADNCAGSPGAPAPTGQHWYYRVDPVNHRRCWYRHAIVPLAARAASESRAAPSEFVSSAGASQSPSAATPQTTDAVSDSDEAASTHTAPHVRVLGVKPVTPPAIDTTPVSEADIAEHMGRPQTPNVAVDEDAKPARAARVATRQSNLDTAHETNHDSLAPARSEVNATGPTPSARLLFSLLALALGIAAALIALLGKIAGASRAPRVSEHPDDAWRRYRISNHQTDEPIMHPENAPFLAPGEPYRAVDLDVPESLDQSSPAKADFPPAPRHGKPWPSERADLTQKDVELPLRILRHRGVVRSETEH
jgi:hypothetical protein